MNNGVVILSWQRCLWTHEEEKQPEQNIWRTLCSTSGEQLCCEIIVLPKLEMRKSWCHKNLVLMSSHCPVQVHVEEKCHNVRNTCGKARTTAEMGEKPAQFVLWEAVGSVLAWSKLMENDLAGKVSYPATYVTCSSSRSACLAEFCSHMSTPCACTDTAALPAHTWSWREGAEFTDLNPAFVKTNTSECHQEYNNRGLLAKPSTQVFRWKARLCVSL